VSIGYSCIDGSIVLFHDLVFNDSLIDGLGDVVQVGSGESAHVHPSGLKQVNMLLNTEKVHLLG